MHCFTRTIASTKHTCAATRNLAALIDRSTSFRTFLRVSAISAGNILESSSIQSLFGMRLLSPLLREPTREGLLGPSGPPTPPFPGFAPAETSRPPRCVLNSTRRLLFRNVGSGHPARGAHRGDVEGVGWTRERS